jgi:hypothetical protein
VPKKETRTHFHFAFLFACNRQSKVKAFRFSVLS